MMKWTMTIVVLAITAALLITGYAGYASPEISRWFCMAGYAFPAALLAMLAALVIFTLTKRWMLLMLTVLGLIAAYKPVSLYCPVNRTVEVPDSAIQLLSYNTHFWGKGDKGDGPPEDYSMEDNIVVNYLAESGADIICLQEATIPGPMNKQIDEMLMTEYQRDSVYGKSGSGVLWIYSRYPIKKKERIDYESKGNLSAAFWLDIDGREVIVINNHLETMGLTHSERDKFRDMMHGNQERDTMQTVSRTIFGKIVEASRKRAAQAEKVASFVRLHSDTPMIVCGDFNDIPQSYTHHTIAEGLTDCYQQTGFGPGYSLSHYGMRVRIDNILCSPSITPYNCYIDNSISASDHQPIRCWMTL